MEDAVNELIKSRVEEDMDLLPGDVSRMVSSLWFTVRHLMTSDKMYVMRIHKLGVFAPRFALVNKRIKKELRKARVYGSNNRDVIINLFSVRRRLIKAGLASKSYYLKQEKRKNGSAAKNFGHQAKNSLEVLQSRIERCRQANQISRAAATI